MTWAPALAAALIGRDINGFRTVGFAPPSQPADADGRCSACHDWRQETDI